LPGLMRRGGVLSPDRWSLRQSSSIGINGIGDSKKIPQTKREELYALILSSGRVGIGIADTEHIDRINILNATKKAMYDAVAELGILPELILVDALTIPNIQTRQLPIIKGDAKSASIGAASIIAKVTRDRIMTEYHALYPQYGFDRHKGYATKQHIDCIAKYGPCPIHRKSFSPVTSPTLFINLKG
jgi:ribonuclease HII